MARQAKQLLGSGHRRVDHAVEVQEQSFHLLRVLSGGIKLWLARSQWILG